LTSIYIAKFLTLIPDGGNNTQE